MLSLKSYEKGDITDTWMLSFVIFWRKGKIQKEINVFYIQSYSKIKALIFITLQLEAYSLINSWDEIPFHKSSLKNAY